MLQIRIATWGSVATASNPHTYIPRPEIGGTKNFLSRPVPLENRGVPSRLASRTNFFPVLSRPASRRNNDDPVPSRCYKKHWVLSRPASRRNIFYIFASCESSITENSSFRQVNWLFIWHLSIDCHINTSFRKWYHSSEKQNIYLSEVAQGESYDLRKRTETITNAELCAVLR